MTATISKYKTVLIGIMMLISLLISVRLEGQVGFHLVGEVLCNENLEKEKAIQSQKIKSADKKSPKKEIKSKSKELVTVKLKKQDSGDSKIEDNYYASEVKFKKGSQEKLKNYKNGI